MKAIVVREFGAPEVMKLEEVPTPEVGAGQVLVRVKAAGVNPVDTYIRAGAYAQKPRLPYTPGKDAGGIVEQVGAGVGIFRPGDRVYVGGSLSGTYAEFALCEEKQVHPIPPNISFEQGAGVFVPYATSYRALFQKAKVTWEDLVLVHGASGAVGIAAVQWALNAHASVVGTASTEEGRNLIKEQGTDFALDHSSENYLERLREISGEKGVDIILEMLANVNLQTDLDVLGMFGRIVIIGNRGSLDFNPRAAMGKDAAIYGMSLFNAPDAEMDEIHNAIDDGLINQYLNPVIGKSFPLHEAAAAHHSIIEDKAFGKTILMSGK